MLVKIDKNQVAGSLQAVEEKLDGAGELILDFAAVQRIDSNAVRVMEVLGRRADEKGIKVVLSGVNVDVYKVLKLVKLDSRFSFVA